MELDNDGELQDEDVKVPENLEDGSWDALMLDDDDKDFAIEVDSDKLIMFNLVNISIPTGNLLLSELCTVQNQ
jgi:hypothetical protein